MPACWQPEQAKLPVVKAPCAPTPEATVAALDKLTEQQVNRLIGVLQGFVTTTPAFHQRILDALELLERDEEEAAARQGTTPAMRLVAHASDERERNAYVDDEEAAREHAALGAGYVE